MLQSAARRLSRQLSARLWHLESRNRAMCMTSSSSGNWTQVEQDDDSDSDSAAALRLRLLDAALPHVSVHGWSVAALHAGARDLSLSPAVVGVLPRGAAQLAEHAVAAANAALAARLAAASPVLSALPLRDALLIGLRTRLELVAPHITAGTWPQAMALLSSSPSSSAASLVLLGQLVDEVLHAAGDVSSDMTWYSKRALLSGVYVASELYMLADYSPGYSDTWGQLGRRLDDALWLAGLSGAAAAAGAGGGGSGSAGGGSSSSNSSSSSA